MSSGRFLSVIGAVLCLSVVAGSLAAQDAKFHRAATNRRPGAGAVAIFKKARSSLECASLCTAKAKAGCCSYGYSRKSRQCRLFLESHLGNYTVEEGYDYFIGCPAPATRIGDPCSGPGPGSSDACTSTANAECRDGKCQCVVGYHFYPGPGTCVKTCPNGYGADYYEVENRVLWGHNDGDYGGGLSEANCKQRCTSDPRCRSLDWGTSACFLSYNTSLEFPADFEIMTGFNYYQRSCA